MHALGGCGPGHDDGMGDRRASVRSARSRAPSNKPCQAMPDASGGGTVRSSSNPSRSVSKTALPPTEIATSARAPLTSIPTGAPGASGSEGEPSGSSI